MLVKYVQGIKREHYDNLKVPCVSAFIALVIMDLLRQSGNK